MQRSIAVPAFALVTAVHLVSQLLGQGQTADLIQVLLMPLLALVLLRATRAPRSREVRLVLVALGFSWLGDTLPRLAEGDAALLTMIGCFLLAQLVYAAAFWPSRHRSVLGRPLALLPYLLAGATIVGLSAREAGALLPAVGVYALAILAMAVLATGRGRVAAIGAAVFVLSDALIALDAFGMLTLPAHAVWVMATYVAAQVLLVLGVLAGERAAAGS